MFNFFKKLITAQKDEIQTFKVEPSEIEVESQSVNNVLDNLLRQIQRSPEYGQLIAEVSSPSMDFDALDQILDSISSLIPNQFESTVRVVRWDGKVIAQKGTVVSQHVKTLMFETAMGEYGLQIVLTPKPQIPDKYRILWLGLDYAGKSTLIHRLRYNEFRPQSRTVGQDIEDFIMDGIRITNVDLGGQKALRKHWTRFPIKPHVIVYVIDAADEQRYGEALAELQDKVLQNEKYVGVPILFLLNKMDLLPDTNAASLVTSRLDLSAVMDLRTWLVQEVSAKTGDGLEDAIEKLAQIVQDQVSQ